MAKTSKPRARSASSARARRLRERPVIEVRPMSGGSRQLIDAPPLTAPAAGSEIDVARQRTPLEPGKRRVEIGVPGTPIFGGLILSDPNAELQFPKSVAIYDKMRRTDGQVKAALLAITLPILSLEWTVEPYTAKDERSGKPLDPQPMDVEISRFVRTDLLEGMSTPWKATLRQILSMLWAGFSVFEKVFEIREDRLVHLRKLAMRMPQTVFRWHVERDGGLHHIEQLGVNPATGTQDRVDIPVRDLVVFTHDKEGADWAGISVLRAAYKSWYMKDWLYRLGVINTERGGGFPVITLPDDPNDRDIAAASAVGESIHLHERAYVMEPPGWKFRMESGTTRIGDVITQIVHHNSQISANILAQFLDFGELGAAGRGATAEYVDLFLMALEAVIGTVEDTVNRHLIAPWVSMNWRVAGYPTLRAQNIRGFNIRRMGLVLNALASGRLITADERLEGFIRKTMGLPDADPDTRRQTPPAAGLPDRFGVPPSVEDSNAPIPGERPTLPQDDPGMPQDRAPQLRAPQLRQVALSEFSTVLVRMPADIAAAIHAWQESRLDPEDLYTGPVAHGGDAKGLEDDPHVTVMVGLHTSSPALVRRVLASRPPAALTLGTIGRFRQAEYDVLLIEVASEDLTGLHAALGAELAAEPSRYRYTPHLTLAFLKPGRALKYLGDKTFKGRTVTASTVWFSPKDGEGAPVEIPLGTADTTLACRRTVLDLDQPLFVRRALTSIERFVNLHEIDTKTRRTAQDMLRTLAPIQREQTAALAKALTTAEVGSLAEVKVSYIGRLASSVKRQLRDVFDYGAAQVRAELFRQAEVRRARVSPGDASADRLVLAEPLTIPLGEALGEWEHTLAIRSVGDAVDYIGVKADLLSQRWAAKLKDTGIIAKLRALRAAMNAAETEAEIEQALAEVGDMASRSIVMQTVSEAFALGRTVQAERLRDRIAEVQYSALLDQNTCDPCEALDGETGPLDDPRLQTPNPQCTGERYGNACRCLNTYLLEGAP